MNVEDVRSFCLSLPYVNEGFPFGDQALVFKIGERMFALLALECEEPYVSLKCDPDRAIELRDRYMAVEPAYHMSKVHWNGVYLQRDLSRDLIIELIRHSYDLVWNKMPKKERNELLTLNID